MRVQIVNKHLLDQAWDEAKVPGWITVITEESIKALADLGKPFKYIGAPPKRRGR